MNSTPMRLSFLPAVLLAQVCAAQSTELVSLDPAGVPGNDASFAGKLSADGRLVAFTSVASNLVPGDTNGFYDVFVRDRTTGQTTRVSVATGGAQGNAHSAGGWLSDDGGTVVFYSWASNLVAPGSPYSQIYAHDLASGQTERVSVGLTGDPAQGSCISPSVSADGRYVAFVSSGSNLVAGVSSQWHVFVRDRVAGQTFLASVSSAGVPGNNSCWGSLPRLSADGRLVVFHSAASNLVPSDTNPSTDVFVHDLLTHQTSLVSVGSSGQQANATCLDEAVSADGRFVAFDSDATNLVTPDTNGSMDVFVHDRLTGATSRVSNGFGPAEADGHSRLPALSADGRFVAFDSEATNLVPGDVNAAQDVFVLDRLTGATELLSVSTSGAQGSGASLFSSISADGRYAAFQTDAPDLVAGDVNGATDVLLRDRGTLPIVAGCFGDGSSAACPCANSGAAGHGCENSAASGGALLTAAGSASLSGDTLVLTSSGELSTATSIFIQGSQLGAPVAFGDGLLCAGGGLLRLYVQGAVGGTVTAPQAGDPPVSARSALLGDPIQLGQTRHYQTYYRDASPAFCPSPPGNTWNVGNSLSAVWGQ